MFGRPTSPDEHDRAEPITQKYDVFAAADRRSAAITYVGSIEAPDDELGRIYAERMFGRRSEHRSLWIVRRTVPVTAAVRRVRVPTDRTREVEKL